MDVISMKAQLFSKIIKASVSSLPQNVRSCPKASNYNFVSGRSAKGDFVIYSFFDEAGKILKIDSSYSKGKDITRKVSWFNEIKDYTETLPTDTFQQRLHVTSKNGKIVESTKETWLSKLTRLVEEIKPDKSYDVHKIQSFTPKEKPMEISYKTNWNGESPKDINFQNCKAISTDGFEYIPLFVSPNSIKRFNHLEKINLKGQGLEEVVPEMKLISKKQYINKYGSYIINGKETVPEGFANPENGLVTIVKICEHNNPLELVDTVAHEYQHATDFSDILRIGGEKFDDMIKNNIKSKRTGIMSIKLSDFKFNSLKKRGPIPAGSEEAKRLSDIKWIIEHESYSEMCLQGKHDEAFVEASAIAKGENEYKRFVNAIERIFDNFGGI